MIIKTVVVGPLQVNCYIIGCPETGKALVVDPGEECDKILSAVGKLGLEVALVVNTHGHFDHIGANSALIEKTGADLLIHPDDVPLMLRAAEHASLYGLKADPSPPPTRMLTDGEVLSFGNLELRVIHIPGHSPGGVCLLLDGHLFSGDALFAGSIGRTDLPGGDHGLLVRGIREKLLILPEHTVVHPGHGPDTSIGWEKRNNPFCGNRA